MKKNILKIVSIFLFILIYLCLGIYGKFIFCLLTFSISLFYGLKKDKSYIALGLISLLIIPNIFIDFSIDNLKYDKNGQIIKKKIIDSDLHESYYYSSICPFISNVCYSREFVSSVGFPGFMVKRFEKQKYYIDILGNVYFQQFSSKREKYLDNKAISEISIFYKTFNIPFSKKDFIIYNYPIGEIFIDEFSNDCEVLMYGAQNGWIEYKKQLVNQLEKSKNNSCNNELERFIGYDYPINKNKGKLLNYLKTGEI